MAATEGASQSRLRVVDDSGEDYLYPRDWFMPLDFDEDLADRRWRKMKRIAIGHRAKMK
jgi:hypothetical protein